LFNWLWARSQGGKFILRIEDTDQERSSLDSVRAILDALRWLGLDWDEGPEVEGDYGPYFQSDRKALYRECVEKLISEGKAYRCYCTKEELDQAREELKAKDPKAQFVYPGTCRHKPNDPSKPHVVRFSTPKEGSTDFNDKVFGVISTPNKEQQDFVLVRRDGYPLYNTAAVIDDHAMGITLIGRGRDHIGNTPQQVMLYQAFGWEIPEFAHLPMMLSPKGEKLSKRHGSVSVHEYRDRGYSPMGVLNYLARFGWSYGDQEIFSRDELIKLFSWDRVNKSDGKFDDKKYADVAFEHLKRPELTPSEEYAKRTLPFLESRGLNGATETRVAELLPLIRERARTFADAAQHLDYFFRNPPVVEEAARTKFLQPKVAPILRETAKILGGCSVWKGADLEALVQKWCESESLPIKDVAQPLRVALTGRTASPPLFDVLELLGREVALARILAGAVLAETTP
jgi:glutamyl-tRNA synthetase